MRRDVRLLETGFSPAEALAPFARAHTQQGALASFVGRVRGGPDVKVLELSHYAPLTLPGMERLADDALAQFDLAGILVHHRVGAMEPGQAIVLVAAAAAHRRAAFDAVDYAMDHLKSRAWFWKRERRPDGWHWIDPTAADGQALKRWA